MLPERRRLIATVDPDIPPVLESGEEVRQCGVCDWVSALVRFQVSFCNIGSVGRFIHQYMVPGLIFWRTRERNRFVPLLRGLEMRINVDNDTAVAEPSVVYQLTYRELRANNICYSSHIHLIALKSTLWFGPTVTDREKTLEGRLQDFLVVFTFTVLMRFCISELEHWGHLSLCLSCSATDSMRLNRWPHFLHSNS